MLINGRIATESGPGGAFPKLAPKWGIPWLKSLLRVDRTVLPNTAITPDNAIFTSARVRFLKFAWYSPLGALLIWNYALFLNRNTMRGQTDKISYFAEGTYAWDHYLGTGEKRRLAFNRRFQCKQMKAL
eukprot:NODE_2822_length_498_cov_37.539084_g2772_i0.p2 GENE.NODE_2822_length_498_cov_37.539084_g2772_i0~~NODE_2822_length_498_cov_37.539084_g2772_i0.p2  ORF type:complete len:129 (+),score=26.16 NODE_2822_length_498_cov_37.539084_g2772_i0:72-458(+)